MKSVFRKIFTVMCILGMIVGNVGTFAGTWEAYAEGETAYEITQFESFSISAVSGTETLTITEAPYDLGEIDRTAKLTATIVFQPNVVSGGADIQKGDTFTCVVPSILANGDQATWQNQITDETTDYGKENGSVGTFFIKDGRMTIVFDDGYIDETKGKIKNCKLTYEGQVNSYNWPEHVEAMTLYYGSIPVNVSFPDITLRRNITVEKEAEKRSSTPKNYAMTDENGYFTYTIRATAGADNDVRLDNVIIGDTFTTEYANVVDVQLVEVKNINTSGNNSDITDQAVRITDEELLGEKDFAWNIGSLNRGETVSVTFKVKLDAEIAGDAIAEKRNAGDDPYKSYLTVDNTASAQADDTGTFTQDYSVPMYDYVSIRKTRIGNRDSDTSRQKYQITLTAPASNPYTLHNVPVYDYVSYYFQEKDAKVFSDGGVESITVKHADGTEETLNYTQVVPFTQTYQKGTTTLYDYWEVALETVKPGDVITINTYLTVDMDEFLQNGKGTDSSLQKSNRNCAAVGGDAFEFKNSDYVSLNLKRNWIYKYGALLGDDKITWTVRGNEKDDNYPDIDTAGMVVTDTLSQDQTFTEDYVAVSFYDWNTGKKKDYTLENSDGNGNMKVYVNADKTGFTFTIPEGYGQCKFEILYTVNAPAAYGNDINYINTVGLNGWVYTASTIRKKVAALNKQWTSFGSTQNDDGTKTNWVQWKTNLFGNIDSDITYTDAIDSNVFSSNIMFFSDTDLEGIEICFNGELVDPSAYTLEPTGEDGKYSGFVLKFNREITVEKDGEKIIPTSANPLVITYRTTLVEANIKQNASIKCGNSGTVSNDAAGWHDTDYDFVYRSNIQDISKSAVGMEDGLMNWTVRVNKSGTAAHPDSEDGNWEDTNRKSPDDYVVEFDEILPAGLEFVNAVVVKDGVDNKKTPEIESITYEKNEDGTPKRNDDGTQTVHIKIKKCTIYNQNKDFISNCDYSTYHNFSWIDVKIYTKITDENALFDNSGTRYTFSNTASTTHPNGVTYTATAEQSIVHQALTKDMTYNAVTAPNANFVLEVNGGEDGPLDLNPNGDTIPVYDQSASTLIVDPNSIRVLNLDTNKPVDFSLDVSELASGKFKIVIPDNMHLRITYDAAVSGRVGESVSLTNSAYFEGQENSNNIVIFSKDTVVLDSAASSESSTMIWLKKVNASNEKLAGAKFKVEAYRNGAWEVVNDSIVTELAGFGTKLSNLEKNVLYRLIETNAPLHYVLDEAPHYFCIPENKDSVVEKPEGFNESVYYCRVASVLYAYNVPYAEVSFEKYTEDGVTLLENAQFRVEDKDGNVITDENGHSVEFTTTSGAKKFWIRPGTYILREIASPEGYTVASPVTFTVNADSTVTYDGRVSENNLVSIKDELSSATIRKVDVEGEKLVGAVMQIKDADGNVVREWTSGTEDEVITGLSVNTEYILHEETAPAGYLLAEDVVFALNPDGTLNQTVSSKVSTDENGVILVTDQKPELEVEKVERKYGETSDTKLADVVIGLYDGQNRIASLTTSETDVDSFGIIEAGKTYTIKEESVPAGYSKFDDFTIVVNSDGSAVISEGAPAQYINGVLILKNTYEPEEVSVSLRVSKTVTGDAPDAKDFVFHLKQDNEDASDPITIESVGANETKSGYFSPLTFTEPGTYSYLISEEHTTAVENYYNGYSFAQNQTVTITVTDDHENGKLLASVSIDGVQVNETDGVYSTVFENVYQATSTSVAIPVVKTFSTDSAPRPSSKDFSFTLKGEGIEEVVTINGEDATVFPAITYDNIGDYTYTISENIPENYSEEYVGYGMDLTEYTVHVSVVDNGGALVAETEIEKDGEVSESAVFTNEYNPEPLEVGLSYNKILQDSEGNILTELPGNRSNDQFYFKVTPLDNSPMEYIDGFTQEDGSFISNASMNFPVAYLPKIVITRAGTYRYMTQELEQASEYDNEGNLFDVTKYYDFDSTIKVVTIRVVDQNGKLEIVKDENGKDYTVTDIHNNRYPDDSQHLNYTNTYTPLAASVSIPVMKLIDGETPVDTKEFEFKLEGKDNAPMPETDSITVSTSGEGGVGSFPAITYDKEGIYTYTVREIKPDTGEDFDPYSYDTTERVVTITVTDNNGTMETELSVEGNTNGMTDKAVFTNTYTPKATEVTIPVTKIVEGQKCPLEKEFVFTIRATEGTPLPAETEVTVVGSGETEFLPITFTSAGLYHYEIEEVNTGETGYTYDSTIIDVTVSVTDEGGKLKADIAVDNEDKEDITFTNTYEPEPVTTTVLVEKKFSEDSYERPEKREFTFTLTGLKDAPMPEEKTTIQVKDGDEGSFGLMTFTKPGTYTYVVEEQNDGKTGYSYDKKHTIVYTVEDYCGVLVIKNAKIDGEEGSSVVFTNTYIPKAATVSIPVSKVVEGGTPKKDVSFTFTIDGEDGAPLPNNTEVSVKAGKTKNFDEIIFTEPGTYTYKVTEKDTKEDGYVYDLSVYTVVVKVTDEEGVLKAEWTVEGNEENRIVFTNTYLEEPPVVNTGVQLHTGIFAGIFVAALAVAGIVILEKKKH